MTTYPLVRLVDEPDPSATVRFDFNAVPLTWPDHDGFDLGAPPLLGAPDATGNEYGLRTLSFRLAVNGTEATALRLQSDLARELQRREGWLLFQLSPSAAPVWFKVYRSSPGAVSLAYVVNDRAENLWVIGLSLAAEPFGYGEEEVLGPFTVDNDPASGVSLLLPSIVGDAPAPLVARLSLGAGSEYLSPVLHMVATPTASRFETFDAATTLGGLGVVAVAEGTASGGTAARISFSGSTPRTALSSTPPRTPGRHLLFARVRTTTTGTAATLTGGGDAAVDSRTVTLPASGWGWVCLGEYAFPRGNQPPASFGDYQPVGALGLVAVTVTRTAGTGDVDVDQLLFLPVTPPGGYATHAHFEGDLVNVTAPWTWFLDGQERRVYFADLTTTPAGFPAGLAVPMPRGEFPVVHPGLNNQLILLRRQYLEGYNDVLSDTTTLEVRYRPRWLWLAGG